MNQGAPLHLLDALSLLEPVLIDDAARFKLLRISELLPWLTGGVFEAYLDQPGRLDYSYGVLVQQEMGHLQQLAITLWHFRERLLPTGPLPLARFLGALMWEDHPIGRFIRSLWFEFDTSRQAEPCLDGLFFDMDRVNLLAREQGQPEKIWYFWLAQVLPMLLSEGTEQAHAALLEAILRLPESAFVSYMGVMLGRQNSLKLCASFLHAEPLVPYLTQLGLAWPEPEVVWLMGLLHGYVEYTTLNLDWQQGQFSPRIGLECYINNEWKASRPFWHGLLEALCQKGICQSEQKLALLNWHQEAKQGQALNQQAQRREINHLKLVYQPGQGWQAKVYLGFSSQERYLVGGGLQNWPHSI